MGVAQGSVGVRRRLAEISGRSVCVCVCSSSSRGRISIHTSGQLIAGSPLCLSARVLLYIFMNAGAFSGGPGSVFGRGNAVGVLGGPGGLSKEECRRCTISRQQARVM